MGSIISEYTDGHLLSTWNQVAPRAYIRQWLCFPLEHEHERLKSHYLEHLQQYLALALHRLSECLPDLTSRLYLQPDHPGHLRLGQTGHDKIPLTVIDQRDSFPWTYRELEAQGFPASAFVGRSFDLSHQLLEDEEGIPVFEVHAQVIDGGLLLGIFFHHSICDGVGMDNRIKTLAEITQDPTKEVDIQYPLDFHVDLPDEIVKAHLPKNTPKTLAGLLEVCPEYILFESLIGPTQFRSYPTSPLMDDIPKAGRIFVVDTNRIDNLKDRLNHALGAEHGRRPLSTFTCLATILWAHVTKARLNSPKKYVSTSPDATYSTPEHVHLNTCNDWRRRAFRGLMDTNAGNTIALPLVTIDTATLLAACGPSGSDVAATTAALAAVARMIDATARSVDEGFVALRTALFRAAPDPRLIGLDADQRDPRYFYINTWRHFGADARWSLPGVVGEGVAPDAVRRGQSNWNMGAGLILPRRKDSEKFEVLVTLDVDSMEILCADKAWRSWLDEVLE